MFATFSPLFLYLLFVIYCAIVARATIPVLCTSTIPYFSRTVSNSLITSGGPDSDTMIFISDTQHISVERLYLTHYVILGAFC